MEHRSEKNVSLPNRLGFHYFPDALHYTQKDTNIWLPVLEEMGIGWLILHSPLARAIPEDFIRSFSSKKINLVVDFNHPLDQDVDWDGLATLIRAYGIWGVRYALFDRYANMRESWGNSLWGNPALVRDYADRFIHFSQIALDNTIRPILGPLVPGGDYWDMAFLSTSLTRIRDSAPDLVKNNLTLSAFAWDYSRSLDWGAGGPAIWAQAASYKHPDEDNQNQQGFRSYEWVDHAARMVYGRSFPTLLLEAGIPINPAYSDNTPIVPDMGKQLAIYGLLRGQNVFENLSEDRLLAAIPPQVIAGNFYVLSSSEEKVSSLQWFQEDGQRQPPAQAIYVREGFLDLPSAQKKTEQEEISVHEFIYRRYVLIAKALQASLDQIFKALEGFMESHKPMVGFSEREAVKAAIITVISPDGTLEQQILEKLKKNGSLVNIIRPEEIPDLTS